MTYSFRTNGNYIDFVHTDNTSLQVESVLRSLHNTSRAVTWSLPEDTTRINFTVDDIRVEGFPITEIDFDGTAIDSQDDFETGIEAMFPGLAGGSPGGSSYLVYTALISQASTTANITSRVLENTIGTVTWTREGVGIYRLSSAGLFTANKTFLPNFGKPTSSGFGAGLPIFTYNQFQPFGALVIEIVSTSVIDFYATWNNFAGGSSFFDDLFDQLGATGELPIEIRVYP